MNYYNCYSLRTCAKLHLALRLGAFCHKATLNLPLQKQLLPDHNLASINDYLNSNLTTSFLIIFAKMCTKSITSLLLVAITFFSLALASPAKARNEATVDTDGTIWARSVDETGTGLACSCGTDVVSIHLHHLHAVLHGVAVGYRRFHPVNHETLSDGI